MTLDGYGEALRQFLIEALSAKGPDLRDFGFFHWKLLALARKQMVASAWRSVATRRARKTFRAEKRSTFDRRGGKSRRDRAPI